MSGLQDATKGKFKNCVNSIRKKLLEDLEQACYQRYSLNALDRRNVRLTYQENRHYERLDAWLKDPARLHKDGTDNLKKLIKERAYTLTNRLIILMQLECRGLRKVKLISQGIEKSAFRTEQEFFVALTQGDDQGFGFILQQVWDQLALELPALFAYNEIHECVPIPGPTLLWLIGELNQPELKDAWTDDTTLGWLYQYWNDPDRKAVDDKLNTTSGKVEAHELSDKTQLFTERYMVEWLVQNSLGAQWLAICAKNGWACLAEEKIKTLKTRRDAWNKRIDAKEVAETEAMPVNGDESFWKYYVPQDLAEETIEAAPFSLDKVKILDPAMGSGHFLVYVFDFLWELYHDQSRLQGKEAEPEQILDWILNQNLHGIDIDNRAVQIGAAALYIKTQEKVPVYRLEKLNLVASDLGISHLEPDDPSIVRFVSVIEAELKLPKAFSHEIITMLKGADYLGSLLQVEEEIARIVSAYRDIDKVEEKVFEALTGFIRDHDGGEDLGLKSLAEQMGKGLRLIELLGQKYDVVMGNPPYLTRGKVAPVLDNLFDDDTQELYEVMVRRSKTWLKEQGYLSFLTTHNFMFLDKFKGIRSFIQREGTVHSLAQLGVWSFKDVSQPGALGIALFIWQKSTIKKDIAVYQRIGSGQHRTDPKFDEKIPLLINQYNDYKFPQSKYAEILGSPMIYWWPEEFRKIYLKVQKLSSVSEVKTGLNSSHNVRFVRYFWEKKLNNISLCLFTNSLNDVNNFQWQPLFKGAVGNRWYQSINTIIRWDYDGKQVKVYNFNAPGGRVQNKEYYFKQGLSFSKIGTDGFLCRLRKFQSIFSDAGSSIFCKNPEKMQVILSSNLSGYVSQSLNPTINNQVGDIEKLPVLDQLSDYKFYLRRIELLYDQLFASTESNLEYAYQHLDSETFEVEEARIRDDIDKELLKPFSPKTVEDIYHEIGESVFDYPHWDGQPASIPVDFKESYQAENSFLALSRKYRLHPDSLLKIKKELGLVHEGQRKDMAFKHLSWAIGVLLGRFDAQTGGLMDLADQRRKEQSLATDPDAPQAHGHGLIYLSVLDDREDLNRDETPNVGNGCLKTLEGILRYKWGADKASELREEIFNALVLECRTDWTAAQRSKKTLNAWIRTDAFDMHKTIYQNRPIYFPLISARKNFFIWVNIHRWNEGTLNSILANYLNPDITLLETRIRRLREDRQNINDTRQLNEMEKEIADLDILLDELKTFTDKVTQMATRGPAPSLQEVEAPFVMDLDDGVMVNSSALWELVQPLWKDPKKWWTSLSAPQGKKDFDWSHLAMRYWPDRVMKKVKKDPSLAVAHSDYGAFEGRDLFKELHPAAAKKWDEQQGKSDDKPVQMELF